jgi:putative ABC transport system permease protein
MRHPFGAANRFRLPWLAKLLLRLSIRDVAIREGMLGDLEEELNNLSVEGKTPLRLWCNAVLAALALAAKFAPTRGSTVAGPSPSSQRRSRVEGKVPGMDDIRRDFRYALRQLARSPGFTVAAVLTLSLGIGATTVAFNLVNGILLRPLPFPDPDRLVTLWERRATGQELTLSFPNFEDWRDQSESFEGITAVRFPSEVTALGGEEPTRGTMLGVSREFFDVIGVQPFLGRPISYDENRAGGERVAVLGHGFWQRSFGGNPDLASIDLTIEGAPFTVVGVMPPGFKVLEEGDLYLPLEQQPFRVRDSHNYRAIGRLAPGVSWEQAQQEMNRIAAGILQAYPGETRTVAVNLRPLRREILGNVDRPLLLLLCAAGLLLILACSNVASTLLARSTLRDREMAIRTAVGASRVRLVHQLFTESLVLAGIAGLVGLGLSHVALALVRYRGPDLVPRLDSVSIDGPVVLFAVCATLFTSVIFGLPPAIGASSDPAGTLHSGQRGDTRRSRRFGWNLLVGGEAALAVVLVVASGLLVRSLQQILSTDTNFRPAGVLTVAMNFSGSRYRSADTRVSQLNELKREFESLPGVTAVGFVNHLPTQSTSMTGTVFTHPIPDPSDIPLDELPPSSGWRVVDEGYFAALGIPLLRGRTFTGADGPNAIPVIILNEASANLVFPGQDPIGKLVRFDPFWRGVDLTVVGVVGEARDWRRAPGSQPEGFVHWPQRTGYTRYLTAVIHTDGDPTTLVRPVRERLRQVAPEVPGTFRTMSALVGESLKEKEFTLAVLSSFAVLSLALAAVGIYGVVSYSVSQRRREIGIRLALGAASGAVRRRIFSRSLGVVAAGTMVGVLGALAAGGVLESLLYGVSKRDPVTGVGNLDSGVALHACRPAGDDAGGVKDARLEAESGSDQGGQDVTRRRYSIPGKGGGEPSAATEGGQGRCGAAESRRKRHGGAGSRTWLSLHGIGTSPSPD